MATSVVRVAVQATLAWEEEGGHPRAQRGPVWWCECDRSPAGVFASFSSSFLLALSLCVRGGVSAVAFVLGWGEMASSSCDADGLILIFQAAADVRRFRPPLLVRKTAGFLAGQGAAAQCRSTLCFDGECPCFPPRHFDIGGGGAMRLLGCADFFFFKLKSDW